jgi:hypothetical protein
MARDLCVEVRQAVVTALNDAGSRTRAIMQEARAYGPDEPDEKVWPFVRTDLPTIAPDFEQGCGDNSTVSFRVHGFAMGPDERNVGALAAAISADLDGLTAQLVVAPEATLADTLWTGTQLMRDTAQQNGWHAAVSIRCEVAG